MTFPTGELAISIKTLLYDDKIIFFKSADTFIRYCIFGEFDHCFAIGSYNSSFYLKFILTRLRPYIATVSSVAARKIIKINSKIYSIFP